MQTGITRAEHAENTDHAPQEPPACPPTLRILLGSLRLGTTPSADVVVVKARGGRWPRVTLPLGNDNRDGISIPNEHGAD